MTAEAAPAQGPYLHMRIAEQGKLHALARQFPLALAHYRYAMRLTAEARDPEVFFRHYLECTVECLEQMGSYDEVLEWCDRAEAFYGSLDTTANPLARRDLAAVRQRRGVTLLRRGDEAGALAALEAAVALARTAEAPLPLAQTLTAWLRARFAVDPRRLDDELARHRYYAVRNDTVARDIALPLPRELLPPGL